MQERYVFLLTEVLRDYSALCGVHFDQRDTETLSRRCRHEGFAFLSITLPTLGQGLEKGLARGFVEPNDFPYFRKGSSKCPSFLKVFFALVFDDEGRLLDDPSVTAICAIRQIAYTFKKIKELTDESKINTAFESFISTEQQIGSFKGIPEKWQQRFSFVVTTLWGQLNSINTYELVPRHGPGSTADRVTGMDKYARNRLRWYERLDRVFPYDAYCVASVNTLANNLSQAEFIAETDEDPVRVIAVPKTATKPRIIALEPTCMQYTQQAVAQWLIQQLETHELVGGHINFSDQTINQMLALEASLTGRLATLDLSDASDRVPYVAVKQLLSACPNLFEAADACRSKRANVGGEIVTLSKFASMGSALCFPIEAMYFYTICVMAQLKEDEVPTYDALKRACKSSYVYGDDIIVPVESTPVIVEALTDFYCKVNKGKSFWTGKFRESCGVDAYAGSDCTPVYVRQHLPTRSKALAVMTWQETANQFYELGLWQTATTIDKMVEKVAGPIPVASRDSEGVHKWSFTGVPIDLGLPAKYRAYNQFWQRPQYKILSAVTPYNRHELSVDDFLLHYYLTNQRVNVSNFVLDVRPWCDSRKSPRRGAGALKYRWR